MTVRISEFFSGTVRARIIGDPDRKVLSALIIREVPLYDVHSLNDHVYDLTVSLRHVSELISVARGAAAKLRFSDRFGLPFVLWRAGRRKVFLAGAAFFVAALYVLSSFIWHVEIEGTDQPEAVATALAKLHIFPGGLLYKVLDQDSVQMALLDALPDISWVGVRISGTSVYVRVIPRTPLAPPVHTDPQNIVAAVPGVVASVLADHGQAIVKSGQFVPQGTVLISGRLEDGKTVHADGQVKAIVWYRTDLSLPLQTAVSALTGSYVQHDYLVIGGFPIQVWGFSHPPYKYREVQSRDTPVTLGDVRLPFVWRVETVYEAQPHKSLWAPKALLDRGLRFAAKDVLAGLAGEAKVLRQNILQHKVEHGNLYMTVWTEVLQDIGTPQPIAPQPVKQ